MAEGGWLGRYEILRRLDANENDELLLARAHGPAGFHQSVVLKRHLARCDDGAPHLQRLAQEALAYALVTHPAVVRLHDFVLVDGYPVLVLEHVHGLSLARLVRTLRNRNTELPDEVALYLGHALFTALAAAHRAKNPENGEFVPVIHRDVNPRNVLVAWSGEVKLGNFGIAKVAGARRSDLTAPGTLHGTYGYMAPEQVLGDPLTVRTDVYMGALVVWELLARRRAFRIDGMAELELLKAMASPVLPDLAALRPSLSPALCNAVRVSLSANPDARSLSAIEMATCIEALVDLRAAREECGRLAASTRDSLRRAPPSSQAILSPLDQSGETEAFRAEDLRAAARRTPKAGVPTMDGTSAATIAPSLAPPVAPRLGPQGSLFTPMPQSLEPNAQSIVPEQRQASGWSIAMLATAGVAAIAIGFFATGAVNGAVRRYAGAVHPLVSAPSSAPDAAPAASLTASASASPAPSASAETTGRIVFPARAAGHRVFVDGRVVGEGQVAWPVACGRHVAKIGSRGKDQTVDVPCGGDAEVD